MAFTRIQHRGYKRSSKSFCLFVPSLQVEGIRFVYIDEISLSNYFMATKRWGEKGKREQPIVNDLPYKKRYTLIGAITDR